MSGSEDWNTKEIRAFKSSFGKRNDFRLFSSEPPHNPSAAYQQARAMLLKRRADATGTFEAMLANHEEFGPNSLLQSLQVRGQELSDSTDHLLAQDHGGQYDMATGALLQQTDQWVAYEARCVSANNEMTVGQDDAGVRGRLVARAQALFGSVDFLNAAAAVSKSGINLGGIKSDIAGIRDSAGADGQGIDDPVHFGQLIERYAAMVRDAAKDVAKASKKRSDQVYTAAIKLLYGLDIVIAPRGEQRLGAEWSFPYDKFIDALGMVPADHVMTEQLTNVLVQKLDGAGADYSAYNKQIRIDPLTDWNFVGKLYTDPESGKWTLVDTFTAVTLHEIGHAVDATYGIMRKFGKNPGCGGWEETHPIQYMMPQYAKFCVLMDESGIPDEPFRRHINDGFLKSLIASLALGNKKPGEAIAELQTFWKTIHDTEIVEPLTTRRQELMEAVPKLINEVDEILPSDREIGAFDERWGAFEEIAAVPPLLDALTQGVPPVFYRDEFIDRFRALVNDPGIRTTDMLAWMFHGLETFNAYVADQIDNVGPARQEAWVRATMNAMPRPVDLKPYLSGASPWKTDLSNQTINELPASHEAYKGDPRWWRYSAADRQSTFVSNYQWRAPGEWFAELYAITWFKKIEPPAAVAKEVRQYLYGGHVTPNQAV